MRLWSPASRAGVTTVILATAAALLAPLAPAAGQTTTLCTSYKGCAAKGNGSGGYARNNDRMYWRMYSGHNCTNYVAYRMVRKGMRNVRPWSGSGNATHWGSELKSRTDRRPRVGSVAWWKAGTSRGGSTGHVAYVEKVLSPSTIVVSQDSWGSTFSWARVEKGNGWPNGFIHLRDTPLRNRSAPKVTGAVRVGQQLTASSGTWRPSPTRVSYRWSVGGTALPKATSSLRLNRHMVGKRVRVQVLARRFGYPATTVTSNRTATVQRGRFAVERSPRVRGRTQVTRRLRVSAGAWSPRPGAVRYQWLADGKRIRGARSSQLRLRPGLVRSRIAVQVTARRPGYEPRTRTLRVGGVAPARLRGLSSPRVRGGTRPGQALHVRLGQTRPHAAVRRVQWLRGGRPIRGATGRTYRLRRGDLGSRLQAVVRYRRPGYRTLVRTTSPTARVKTTPRVKVSASRVRHGARLTVTAHGGGKPLRATVAVTRRGRVVARDTLRRGTATVRLRGLQPGRRRVVVVVRGTPTTIRAEVPRRIRVR